MYFFFASKMHTRLSCWSSARSARMSIISLLLATPSNFRWPLFLSTTNIASIALVYHLILYTRVQSWSNNGSSINLIILYPHFKNSVYFVFLTTFWLQPRKPVFWTCFLLWNFKSSPINISLTSYMKYFLMIIVIVIDNIE